jgi:hypothetical protein
MSEHTPERWLPLPGFESYYDISDQGRAWSRRSGKILKPGFAEGYPMILPQVGGVRRKVYIHRAVAAAFIGLCPPGQEVRHKDGIRAHCWASNLEYGTSADNHHDMVRHGTHAFARRDKCRNGHPYTEENTYRWGNARVCRICRQATIAAWLTRNPEAAARIRERRNQRKREERAA